MSLDLRVSANGLCQNWWFCVQVVAPPLSSKGGRAEPGVTGASQPRLHLRAEGDNLYDALLEMRQDVTLEALEER